ncbi:PQQ-dependent sugar dehydrogenase [Prosthecobacter fusiformis]|nr:sorbosone dehydrogenase family protein [Prosthecobacter fusiformis]
MKTISLLALSALSLITTVSWSQEKTEVLTGKEAMGDWTTDAPGVRRHLRVEDLPPPNEKESAKNRPKEVKQPEGAWPKAPAGFKVTHFATGLKKPRVIVTAPNGDIFVAESKSDQITILRDADGDGKPELNEVFADGLKQPFGIAFYPPGPEPTHIYIGNTDAVVRMPYRNGQTKAEGKPDPLVELSAGGQLTGGGHWTRDIVFSKDGKKLFIAIGSKSNVDWTKEEEDRARIFETGPEGQDKRVFAWGVRNPVGLAIHPVTGDLWASVNERDELGDNLVPDYVTRITEGGFYGWPWYYMGGHQDPRHPGARPELKDKVLTPDVILQAHSASLDMTFYDGKQFPEEYHNNAFASEHGSWNRTRRTGYKVIHIPTKEGKATGEYVDFLTGFVTADGDVWGRPVGVTVAKDGALLVSDDTGDCIWRVAYEGGSAQ